MRCRTDVKDKETRGSDGRETDGNENGHIIDGKEGPL